MSMQQQECVGDVGDSNPNSNGEHEQFLKTLFRNDVKLSTEQPIRCNEICQRKTLLGNQHQEQSMRQAHDVNFASSLMHTDTHC